MYIRLIQVGFSILDYLQTAYQAQTWSVNHLKIWFNMMQTSSPLAAMSSGFGPAWRFDNPVRPSFINCGPSSYSQMSLNAIANKKTMGYFDLDMSMTSSPTSCLAADLSQNFHIDKRYANSVLDLWPMWIADHLWSPAFPTPRRSLFNNLNTLSNLSVSRRKFSLSHLSIYFANQPWSTYNTSANAIVACFWRHDGYRDVSFASQDTVL